MSIHLAEYYVDILEFLDQLLNVDEFYLRVCNLKDLILQNDPTYKEMYFVACFIQGLQSDIKEYVLQGGPRTLNSAYELALHRERDLKTNSKDQVLDFITDDLDIIASSRANHEIEEKIVCEVTLNVGGTNEQASSLDNAMSIATVTFSLNEVFLLGSKDTRRLVGSVYGFDPGIGMSSVIKYNATSLFHGELSVNSYTDSMVTVQWNEVVGYLGKGWAELCDDDVICSMVISQSSVTPLLSDCQSCPVSSLLGITLNHGEYAVLIPDLQQMGFSYYLASSTALSGLRVFHLSRESEELSHSLNLWESVEGICTGPAELSAADVLYSKNKNSSALLCAKNQAQAMEVVYSVVISMAYLFQDVVLLSKRRQFYKIVVFKGGTRALEFPKMPKTMMTPIRCYPVDHTECLSVSPTCFQRFHFIGKQTYFLELVSLAEICIVLQFFVLEWLIAWYNTTAWYSYLAVVSGDVHLWSAWHDHNAINFFLGDSLRDLSTYEPDEFSHKQTAVIILRRPNVLGYNPNESHCSLGHLISLYCYDCACIDFVLSPIFYGCYCIISLMLIKAMLIIDTSQLPPCCNEVLPNVRVFEISEPFSGGCHCLLSRLLISVGVYNGLLRAIQAAIYKYFSIRLQDFRTVCVFGFDPGISCSLFSGVRNCHVNVVPHSPTPKLLSMVGFIWHSARIATLYYQAAVYYGVRSAKPTCRLRSSAIMWGIPYYMLEFALPFYYNSIGCVTGGISLGYGGIRIVASIVLLAIELLWVFLLPVHDCWLQSIFSGTSENHLLRLQTCFFDELVPQYTVVFSYWGISSSQLTYDAAKNFNLVTDKVLPNMLLTDDKHFYEVTAQIFLSNPVKLRGRIHGNKFCSLEATSQTLLRGNSVRQICARAQHPIAIHPVRATDIHGSINFSWMISWTFWSLSHYFGLLLVVLQFHWLIAWFCSHSWCQYISFGLELDRFDATTSMTIADLMVRLHLLTTLWKCSLRWPSDGAALAIGLPGFHPDTPDITSVFYSLMLLQGLSRVFCLCCGSDIMNIYTLHVHFHRKISVGKHGFCLTGQSNRDFQYRVSPYLEIQSSLALLVKATYRFLLPQHVLLQVTDIISFADIPVYCYKCFDPGIRYCSATGEHGFMCCGWVVFSYWQFQLICVWIYLCPSYTKYIPEIGGIQSSAYCQNVLVCFSNQESLLVHILGTGLRQATEFLELVRTHSATSQGVLVDRQARQFHWPNTKRKQMGSKNAHNLQLPQYIPGSL